MNDPLMHLRQVWDSYSPLTDDTWQQLQKGLSVKTIAKGTHLYAVDDTLSSFAFLHSGLMRAYMLDENGQEYNKNFFADGRFPGVMSSLLKAEPSMLGIEAIEASELIVIDFAIFRQVLFNNNDLMKMHILYLEKHWLKEKELKEISYLQFEAKDRYLKFLTDFADVAERIPQYHIASYLGVTPTQLSRIKKTLKK
ncbi:Crp/Fnr family transcriptional regulator [Catenovulum sp. SM1970]|uniref:Crp/Fnr family transcriptional regulator n=1 Tax=Marinifaba aquimaris TaxID=2741323 RepID=UPI0015730389|nr:Crp/Fnr family transcriptional regulator [Marinifaba aquimaris]NTS78826.1 Crp/Fnr family transcriptional regulator [Marinifaba aquimaris]